MNLSLGSYGKSQEHANFLTAEKKRAHPTGSKVTKWPNFRDQGFGEAYNRGFYALAKSHLKVMQEVIERLPAATRKSKTEDQPTIDQND